MKEVFGKAGNRFLLEFEQKMGNHSLNVLKVGYFDPLNFVPFEPFKVDSVAGDESQKAFDFKKVMTDQHVMGSEIESAIQDSQIHELDDFALKSDYTKLLQ